MNRYLVFLTAFALVGCIDGTGTDTTDSDSDTEPGFFTGDPLIWAVNSNCVDGATDQWTFEFFLDGLSDGITIDIVETGDPASNRWTETHVLDFATSDLHYDGQGSPAGTTTNAEAAAMDPADDADDDDHPDWGATTQDFTTQPFDDADGLVGSWDHWYDAMNDVALPGDVDSSGAVQDTLFDCAFNDHTGGASGSLAFKATMLDDSDPPVAVDCVIWGYQASGPNSTFAGDGCICVDPDAGDCAD